MYKRPAMEKMVISNTIIPISVFVDYLALNGLILVSFKNFIPEQTQLLMDNYPNLSCAFLGLGSMFGLVPLLLSLAGT